MRKSKFSPLSLTAKERKMKNLYGDYFEVDQITLSDAERSKWYDAMTYQIMITEKKLGKRLVNRRLIEKLSESGSHWIFGWKATAA